MILSLGPYLKRHDELLQEFARLLAEYHRMQSAQLVAVFAGDDFPFEDWIEKAAARVIQAKSELRAHRQEHGLLKNCGQI